MKREYDLTKMKSRPNPYAKQLKRQVTLRMRPDVLAYFQTLSDETGIPCNNLMNLYLQECMASHRKLNVRWAS